VELALFLAAVQRHVRGVDVEHEFFRRRLMAGDELINQHAVQRNGLRPRGARLQATQRGRTGECIDPAHGSLHQQIRAQHVVVIEVFIATAQTVDALCHQVSQAVRDACRIAWVTEHRSRRAAQTYALVDAT